MEVSGEGIETTAIPLKSIDADGNGVFEGPVALVDGMIANGTSLAGTIKMVGTKNSSTSSIDDLLNNCSHNYSTVGMTYGATDVVSLLDDNAYLEAFMSPLQHKLMVNSVDYPVNTDNGKVWILLEKDSPIEMSFYHKSSDEVSASTIYTLDRNGYVDLGVSILWADKNINSASYNGYGDFYTCEDANNDVQSPARVPSPADFSLLVSGCVTKADEDGPNWRLYRKRTDGGDDYSSEPYIILPTAGYLHPNYNGESLRGKEVWLWTNTRDKALEGQNGGWNANSTINCEFQFPVRPVIGENAITIFNSSSEDNPTLTLSMDVGTIEITRNDGVIDLNGHSVNVLFLQNNVEGKTVTVRNGTISTEIDGKGGTSDFFKGTVVLEDMNVPKIWTDGHSFVINSGTYGKILNTKNQYTPGIVTINDGFFEELSVDESSTYTINGGKFKQNLATMLSDLNITIPSGKNIYDNGEDEEYRYEVR